MVDAEDLKSFGYCNRVGSSPTKTTKIHYTNKIKFIKMKKSAKSKLLNFGTIAMITPHLFCCVLPIVSMMFGIVAPIDHSEFHIIPHNYMPIIFIISGIFLITSWLLIFEKKCNCECKNCHNSNNGHKWQKILFWVSAMIYIIGLIIHISE